MARICTCGHVALRHDWDNKTHTLTECSMAYCKCVRFVNSKDWGNLVETTGRKLLREFKKDLEE